MKISLSNQALTSVTADLLAVGVQSSELKKSDTLKKIDTATRGTLSRLLEDGAFKGEKGETLTLTAPTGFACKRLVVVGLGSGNLSVSDVRLLEIGRAHV